MRNTLNNSEMSDIEEKISRTITELTNDFEVCPDKYLTEDDVRCILFNKLMEYEIFNQPQQTSDGSYSIPVHTEVRWYGESGKLKWRSDIVFIDISSLRVRNNIFRLPSKGYGFNKPLAIIEIKFRRTNGPSDKAFIKKILEDVDKLQKIKKELSGNYPCYLVVLDKKNDIKERTVRIDDIKIYYKYSGNNHQAGQGQRIQDPYW